MACVAEVLTTHDLRLSANPDRIGCMGRHDPAFAVGHMKATTTDPTPQAAWSGDEVERSRVRFASGAIDLHVRDAHACGAPVVGAAAAVGWRLHPHA